MIYKRKDLKVFWTLVILVTYLLFWTILSFETSPFYFFSIDTYPFFELSDEEINIWAVRGQIGDILAGHFSALAFFAIALSIYFQSEGNKQIKDSLTIQSKALEAQIKELQESRKESEKQTEEFFISNMNVKLDRYYRILDKNLEIVGDNYYRDYKNSKDRFDLSFSQLPLNEGIDAREKRRHRELQKQLQDKKTIKEQYETKIKNIILILNLIYDEIEILKGSYDISYQRYRQELKLRLDLNKVLLEIKKSFEGADKCQAFSLLEEEQK